MRLCRLTTPTPLYCVRVPVSESHPGTSPEDGAVDGQTAATPRPVVNIYQNNTCIEIERIAETSCSRDDRRNDMVYFDPGKVIYPIRETDIL